MWHCNACDFLNEDLDDVCAKCGELRPAPGLLADATQTLPAGNPVSPKDSAAVSPTASDATLHSAPAPPTLLSESTQAALLTDPRRKALSAVEAAQAKQGSFTLGPPDQRSSAVPGLDTPRRSGFVVAFFALAVILGLLAVGYLAWARGLVVLPAWLESRLPAPPTGITDFKLGGGSTSAKGAKPAFAAITPQASSAEEEEQLAKLEDSREPRLRPLTKLPSQLRILQGRLAAVQAQPALTATDDKARDAELAELSSLYTDMLAQYNAFEDAAAKAKSSETDGTFTAMRAAFTERFGLFLDLLGAAYVSDTQIERAEYVLADKLQQAVATRGQLDVDALQAHWTAAVRARQQAGMEALYTKQFDELHVRLETVHDLRRKFNAAGEQLGPLNMGSGKLTTQASALLDMYDAYSDKLEALWADWKTIAPTMPALSDRPDRLDQVIKQYTDLLKSEHLDCFKQMYRIYALDHELNHPAYKRLKDRYAFVQREWHDKDSTYQAVFRQYEGEWSRTFQGPGRFGTDVGDGTEVNGPPGTSPPGAAPPGGGGPPQSPDPGPGSPPSSPPSSPPGSNPPSEPPVLPPAG